MENFQWDMKSDYMLAFTVCKYGINPERWNSIANDLADYINTTPEVKIRLEFIVVYCFFCCTELPSSI